MERFCKDLREHATEIINYEKKEMIPLTTEENETYKKQKVCYMCEKELSAYDDGDNENYDKVRDSLSLSGKFKAAAHSICNLRYKTPKEISMIFHNGSTYDYHFIINQLAKENEGKFECFGENTEKYITFSISIKKT